MSLSAIESAQAQNPSFAAHRLWSELTARDLVSAARRIDLLLKAGFNPNQPRVPKGNHRESGQWAKPPKVEGARQDITEILKLVPGVLPPEVDEWIRQLPPLPVERPPDPAPYAKQVARTLFRLGARLSPLGRLADVIDAAHWIHDYGPEIVAYLDPPKKLAELQAGAELRPKTRGYDVHHIVEQDAKNDPAFEGAHMLNSPENLALIPRMRHWELNAWYQTPNVYYGGLTPRQYLKGKDWLERFDVGEAGMRAVGVLKP